MKDNMKFGVEIEYKIAQASKILQGLKNAGLPARIKGYHPSSDFTSWDICSDASVSRGHGNNMRGGEIVSPVLTLADLDQLEKVCSVLSDCNADIDYNCGLHVHFSWDNMQGSTIKNIIERYKKFEDQFDGIMAPTRRGNSNTYCRSVSNLETPDSDCLNDVSRIGSRTNKINLTNLGRYSRTNTIEFRHHNGTTDFFKIKNWVLFLADFIQESKKKVTMKTFDWNSERDTPREIKRLAWGSLKHTMKKFDIEMKQNRGFGFTFTYGNTTERVAYSDAESLYVPNTRKLDEKKLQDFVGFIRKEQYGSADTFFCGVEEKLVYYYMGRRDMFSQRRA